MADQLWSLNILIYTQVRTPVPWLSEVLAVMEEIVEVCQEISDKVSDLIVITIWPESLTGI